MNQGNERTRRRILLVAKVFAVTGIVVSATVVMAAIGYRLAGSAPLALNEVMVPGACIAASISPFVVGPLLYKSQEMQRLVTRLDELAHTDPLTEVPNRRAFFHRARELMLEASVAETPVAVLMIDVDRFKVLNDKHGHEWGVQRSCM